MRKGILYFLLVRFQSLVIGEGEKEERYEEKDGEKEERYRERERRERETKPGRTDKSLVDWLIYYQ